MDSRSILLISSFIAFVFGLISAVMSIIEIGNYLDKYSLITKLVFNRVGNILSGIAVLIMGVNIFATKVFVIGAYVLIIIGLFTIFMNLVFLIVNINKQR